MSAGSHLKIKRGSHVTKLSSLDSLSRNGFILIYELAYHCTMILRNGQILYQSPSPTDSALTSVIYLAPCGSAGAWAGNKTHGVFRDPNAWRGD